MMLKKILGIEVGSVNRWSMDRVTHLLLVLLKFSIIVCNPSKSILKVHINIYTMHFLFKVFQRIDLILEWVFIKLINNELTLYEWSTLKFIRSVKISESNYPLPFVGIWDNIVMFLNDKQLGEEILDAKLTYFTFQIYLGRS